MRQNQNLTNILTLKQSRPRLAMPIPARANAFTRTALQRSAVTLRQMVKPSPSETIAELERALEQAQAERDAALNAAISRVQREERIKAVTIRIVDRRNAWAAKMGLKQRLPLVAITRTQIITADVWQQTQSEA